MSSKTWEETAVCFSSRACRAHVSSHSPFANTSRLITPTDYFERKTDCRQSILREKKNAVHFIQISLFIPEIFKFLKRANWPNDDVIHSIKFWSNMMKFVSEKFDSLQWVSTKCAPQYELNSLVSMATLWVSVLPSHFLPPLAFHFDICKCCFECLIPKINVRGDTDFIQERGTKARMTSSR